MHYVCLFCLTDNSATVYSLPRQVRADRFPNLSETFSGLAPSSFFRPDSLEGVSFSAGGFVADRIPPAAIVFYEDHLNTEPLSIEMMPWESTPEGSEATGVFDLFSEHEFTDCAPCPGGKKCKKKFSTAFSPAVPREGTTRADENVDWVSLLVFDFDHVTRVELEGVCDRLAGLESLLCSTHSHQLKGNPDDCCVRIIFPLARPLTPTEYRHVHREVRKRYGLEWTRSGEKGLTGADPSAKDISRLYFLPTAPVGSETLVGHETGALLNLDELLQNVAPEPPRAAPKVPRPVGVVPPSAPADMDALRRCLHGYNPHRRDKDDDEVISRKELVQRVEEGEPLVDVEEKGQRERSCHRLAVILAHLLPDGTSIEAVLELVRPSIMSLPVLDGDGEDDTTEARFEKIRKSWFKGLEQKAEQRVKKELKRAEKEKFRNGFQKRFKVKSSPSSIDAPTGEVSEDDPDVDPDDDDSQAKNDPAFDGWEDLFIWAPEKKDGTRCLTHIDENAKTHLAYSPEWRLVLRYNEVTKDVVVVGESPLEDHETEPSLLSAAVKYWLQKQGRKSVKLKKNEVMDVVVNVARMNAFDPVKDYLNNVKWNDGVPRVDTFLEKYCGARIEDGLGNDITGMVQRMSRCWLIGAVARGLNPGCKMDTVLILEGDQGVKKSTMLGVLGGEWFTDSPIVIGDKDSKMLAGCSWIAEMAELSSMHASAVEPQKAFFSSRIDKFRPPYGYAIETFPRRCVFAGSTNDDRYMNDITGNRRFWPVWCVKFDIRGARRDRDKIWAEATAIYKAGGAACPTCVAAKDGEDRCAEHRWWFTAAENKDLEKINNQRLKNEFAEAITDYILKMDPIFSVSELEAMPKEKRAALNMRPRAFSMYEIAVDILKLAADRVNSQQGPIGRALKTLGFKRERCMVNGARSYQHTVPDDLLTAPKRVRGRHLYSVPNPKASAPPAATK